MCTYNLVEFAIFRLYLLSYRIAVLQDLADNRAFIDVCPKYKIQTSYYIYEVSIHKISSPSNEMAVFKFLADS